MKNRRLLETIFRHRILLVAPIVITFLLGTAHAFTAPRMYKSSATIWTDAAVPNPSTIVESNGGSPPSANQQTVLSELLGTRSFLLDVGLHGPTAGYISKASPDKVDRALDEIAKSVTVGTAGPQVLVVSLTFNDARLAKDLNQAVVARYIDTITTTLRSRTKSLADFDKQQLDGAIQSLSSAQSALQQYTNAHPGLAGSTTDGGASQLVGAVSLAQQQAADAQKAYTKDSADLGNVSDASFIHVIDQPSRGIKQAVKKKLVFGAAAGLVAGLTLSAIVLLLLLSLDKSVQREEELEGVLSLRVIGSIDEMEAGSRQPARKSS